MERATSTNPPTTAPIKANVFDLCYSVLAARGYNVINERLPFPGSGQQEVFREKFNEIVNG
jgi:hypothetical protein